MSSIPVVKFPYKRPWEVIPYALEMKRWMAKGDKIDPAEVLARVYEKGGDPDTQSIAAMLIATALDEPGRTIVQVTVGAGDPDLATEPQHGLYRFRVRVTCASGNKYQAEGEFQVREATP